MNFDLSSIIPSAEVAKRIAKIAKVGASLQAEIHEIAVQTLAHIAAHGDTTLAIRLLNGLPNGQRVKALGFWYGEMSGGKATFSYDKVAATWQCRLAKDRAEDGSDFDLDRAVSVTFADLTAEKSPSTFNGRSLLSFMKRKANEDGLNNDGTPKVTPFVREYCTRMYAQLEEILKQQGKAEPVVALATLIRDE